MNTRHPLNVVESVPFHTPHAFDLRFNHLIHPSEDKTYIQLMYKFGLDETHYEEFEVLLPTYKAGQTVDSTP